MKINLIGSTYEVFSIPSIMKMARRDCDALVLDPQKLTKIASAERDGGMLTRGEKYIYTNTLGYYVCANTWVLLTFDLAGIYLGNLLASCIRTYGLVRCIKTCKTFSDHLVKAAHKAERLDEMSAVAGTPEMNESGKMFEFLHRLEALPFITARQIAVYPKRFTPIVPARESVLHEEAISKFVTTNSANVETEKKMQHYCALLSEESDVKLLPLRSHGFKPDGDLVELLSVARTILRTVVGKFKGFSNQKFPRIGPGACRNAGRSKLERLERMVSYGNYELSHTPTWRQTLGCYHILHPDLRKDWRYSTRVNPLTGEREVLETPLLRPGRFYGTSENPQVCRLSSVPKTVDTRRLIALEDVGNMSKQLYLKDELQSRLDGLYATICPILRQEENKEFARQCCESDMGATLDLSHASDSVTKALVRLLFHQSWWTNGFERCVPYAFILKEYAHNEEPQKLHMFATMGCGCTFVVEDLVFFSLSAATILISDGVQVLADCRESLAAYLVDKLRVMGDDIIILSRYKLALEWALAECGFTVNLDKSFGDGRFRESCGADWIAFGDGPDRRAANATCVYYPRIPVGSEGADTLCRTFRDWDASSQEQQVTCGLIRLVALQHALYWKSANAASFLLDFVRKQYPDYSTSFPGEHDLALWTETPEDAEYVYPICVPTVLWHQWRSTDHRRTERAIWSYATAYEAFQYWTGALRAEDPDNRPAELSVIQRILRWTRRRVWRVPTVFVSQRYTGINPGSAEILGYELALISTDAEADDILDVAIIGPRPRIVELMKHRAQLSVRPTPPGTAQLFAEAYEFLISSSYSVE